MKRLIFFIMAFVTVVGCTEKQTTWDSYELYLIRSPKSALKILDASSEYDLEDLREESIPLTKADIRSGAYDTLCIKMKSTLKLADGVGLAAPQVDIKRRVVAVQRLDKFGAPVMIYPNVRIIKYEGELKEGWEGCLSVSGKWGVVPRYQDITIRYTSPVTLKDTTERVLGYPAVIFQHECDHLDGILYIDKAVKISDDKSCR